MEAFERAVRWLVIIVLGLEGTASLKTYLDIRTRVEVLKWCSGVFLYFCRDLEAVMEESEPESGRPGDEEDESDAEASASLDGEDAVGQPQGKRPPSGQQCLLHAFRHGQLALVCYSISQGRHCVPKLLMCTQCNIMDVCRM